MAQGKSDSRSGGLESALVERKLINAEQAEQARERSETDRVGFVTAAIGIGLPEDDIVRAAAEETGTPFIDLTTSEPDPAAVTLIDGALARKHTALPVGYAGDRLLLALGDPEDGKALEEIAIHTGLVVDPVLAVPSQIRRAIDANYEPEASRPEPEGEFAGDGTEIKRVGQRLGVGDETVPVDVHELLEQVLVRGASDLHLTSGVPPVIRLHGDLVQMTEYPMMKPIDLQKVIYGMLTQKQRERFETDLELDFSYSLPGKARFRVNIYLQRGALGAAFRLIPFQIKTVEELGLPAQTSEFARLPRGLVVVTGPTGSGKSTTLASLVDIINRDRPVHIMTVEDPIEFLHAHKRAVINQREVGEDTLGFATALKHVLRQDPDVILVGEMRDLETIHMAITAAETGHLVFGTLHTQDAPQTIDRIIDVFPPHQQEQVRVQLAGALMGVVAQQLLQTPDGRGRVVAAEILVVTPAVRNLIREAKTHQVYSIMQAGAQFGMLTMDAALATLVQQGRVTFEHAREKCHNAEEFARQAGGGARPAPAAAGTSRARVVG